MVRFTSKMEKTMWEKEKMQVITIFSFSYNVTKRLFPNGHQTSGMCGKELTFHHTVPTFGDPKQENFQPFSKRNSIFGLHLFCHLQMFSLWTSLKFCHLVKG